MSKVAPQKSLKDQNRWQLWLIIAANVAVFYVVVQTEVLTTLGLKGLLFSAANLLPIGLALVVTSVVNGLLSATTKARLVFLRWHHSLPGHRSFSKHGPADPRVDIDRLKLLLGVNYPTCPEDENRIWYQFYKEVETEPAVDHIHREFLLNRDYAAVSFLFLIIFGLAAVLVVPSLRVALIYCAALLLQFVVVRHSAATYGIRLVTTVMARKSANFA